MTKSLSPRKLLSMLACVVGMSSLSTANAQVVQLPSFRNFSYTGSAWVPDAGTGTFGGNRYSSSGSTSRGIGPYGGRAIGGSRGGSSLSASVQIIDLQAMDDAILNANVARDPKAKSIISAGSPAAGGGRKFLTGLDAGPYGGDKEVQTHDPNEWNRALAGHNNLGLPAVSPSQAESDIRYYLRKGKEAERGGRILASRVYYRMAVEAMTPDILERYKRILDERKEQKKAEDVADAKAKSANRIRF